MTPYSPFVQLFFVVLAGAVVVLYIQPTIHSIKGIQEKTASYEAQLKNVDQVNNILADIKAKVDDVSVENNQAIDRYLPNSLDPLLVMRDLEALTHEVGVNVVALNYTMPASEASDVVVAEGEAALEPLAPAGVLTTHVKLSVTTDYQTLKKLLHAIDINNYPLEVSDISVKPGEKDGVTADLDLVTYSLAPRAS